MRAEKGCFNRGLLLEGDRSDCSPWIMGGESSCHGLRPPPCVMCCGEIILEGAVVGRINGLPFTSLTESDGLSCSTSRAREVIVCSQRFMGLEGGWWRNEWFVGDCLSRDKWTKDVQRCEPKGDQCDWESVQGIVTTRRTDRIDSSEIIWTDSMEHEDS